jgi:hypothetical protein
LGNVASVMPVHEIREIEQLSASRLEFETEGAAHGQILLNGSSEGVHRAPPGHGRASVRNESRSTLV